MYISMEVQKKFEFGKTRKEVRKKKKKRNMG